MWTPGEFDFRVVSDDSVRPNRTVNKVAEAVRLSAIAVVGQLRRIGQQYTGYLSFKRWQWTMAAVISSVGRDRPTAVGELKVLYLHVTFS